jgi:predicted signal transduction protein with EAL and GGDEF domain
MGASVGLAFFPEDALELNKLIEFADLKMYEHKRARKVINLNV